MNFGNEKEVHVKSYTREGENVKEHWRSKPGHRGFVENVDYEDTRGTIFLPESREDGPRMYSLEGGVEITVGLGQMILDVLKQIAQGAYGFKNNNTQCFEFALQELFG